MKYNLYFLGSLSEKNIVLTVLIVSIGATPLQFCAATTHDLRGRLTDDEQKFIHARVTIKSRDSVCARRTEPMTAPHAIAPAVSATSGEMN
jgi:ABC-type transport system involved in Fe-S cluster assembly fused permease/ATPase subunit